LQDGSQLRLSEADRKALVLGLALHEKGKASLEAGKVQVRRKLFAMAMQLASTQGRCKHASSPRSRRFADVRCWW
jgi:hypothetical protein